MKLTIERDKALAAVGRVQGAVLARNTIPILNDVLLEAREGRLTVVAHNQESEMVCSAEATIETAGSAAVPASLLHDVLKNLPGGAQIALTLDGQRVTLKAGRSRFQLPTLPVADFPSFGGGGAEHQAEIGCKALARLIDRTLFCVSKEETRYYLRGVHLHTVVREGARRLRAVATDGGRLACVEIDCPEGWEAAPGFTLPSKTVAELRRMIEGSDGTLSFSFSGTLFRAELGATLLASRVIDGNFPDYTRVIPQDAVSRMDADVTELLAGLKRCVLMTGDKMRMVRMALAEGAVTLFSRNGDGGEAEERVEVAFEGEPCELRFNAALLMEIIGSMAGERVEIAFGGQADPAKLLDPKEPGVTYVCMPLRL
jgi:DNA polymerase-3 subunit beta